jgi:hypothetical protein
MARFQTSRQQLNQDKFLIEKEAWLTEPGMIHALSNTYQPSGHTKDGHQFPFPLEAGGSQKQNNFPWAIWQ